VRITEKSTAVLAAILTCYIPFGVSNESTNKAHKYSVDIQHFFLVKLRRNSAVSTEYLRALSVDVSCVS
jgi:hypothetical protein